MGKVVPYLCHWVDESLRGKSNIININTYLMLSLSLLIVTLIWPRLTKNYAYIDTLFQSIALVTCNDIN